MQRIQDIWAFLAGNIGPHAPFVFYAFAFAFIGQIMKRFVFSETNVAEWDARREVYRLGEQKPFSRFWLTIGIGFPLPLHPIVAALGFAFMPGLWMSPGVADTLIMRATYLLGAALLSLALYDIVHAVLKNRGLDIKLPGEASRKMKTDNGRNKIKRDVKPPPRTFPNDDVETEDEDDDVTEDDDEDPDR